MRKSIRVARQAGQAIALVTVSLLSLAGLAQVPRTKVIPVTPVSGESWLSHLRRPFQETSMGKTWRLGPPAPMPGEAPAGPSLAARPGLATQVVTLHGADLYRMNCRGCHGEAGLGAPPEINSVINPVRATSAGLLMERMKSRGMDISRHDANEMARQAQAALLQRLHHGGKDMPPFPQLNETEIRALVAYLNQLADLPGAEKQQVALRESPLQVGEHIVKATCHICHSAMGLNPTAIQLMQGAIPPLSALTTRVTQAQLIRKVTQGAPVVMGDPALPERGRMPVFDYLTEEEAGDVYLYLTLYPPVAEPGDAPSDDSQPGRKVMAATMATGGGPVQPPPSGNGDDPSILWLSALASVIGLLLVGGLAITYHEFKRLGAQGEARYLAARAPQQVLQVLEAKHN